MARPLTGSTRFKGGAWEATVPEAIGSKKRITARFSTEEEAKAWCARSVAQLKRGITPTVPAPFSILRPKATDRLDVVRNGPDFERMAMEWVALVYDQNHQGQAERAKKVRDTIRIHILPFFSGPIPLRGELRPAEAGEVAVIDWVRAQAGYKPANPGAPIVARRKGLARKYTGDHLRTFGEIVDYARTQGFDVQDLVGKVVTMEPRNGKKKRRGRLADYHTCREIAAGLHVVHQLVFWLQRVLGVRVSESYGIKLSAVTDLDSIGLLQVEAQGGRTFQVRNADEVVELLQHVETTKTDAGYRLIVIPASLMVLIRVVIAAYHVDADGNVDLDARLIPTINSEQGGQAGFRSAFSKVTSVLAVDSDEDTYTAHDLRKSLCSDLGWNAEVSELLQRRVVGHRAGTDVFAATYLLDRREIADLRPAADGIEADIARTIGTLIVPTALRPNYGRDVYRTRRHIIEVVLVEAGIHQERGELLLDTAEVAAQIGRSQTTARTMMRNGVIPAVKVRGEWMANLDDVTAHAERWDGWWALADVADAAQVTYHQAYAVLGRLNIEPQRIGNQKLLMLSADEAKAMIAEFERLTDLRDRSMLISEACEVLTIAVSTANSWIKKGRLLLDPESDGSGSKYVTRASVTAELESRGRRAASPSVALGEFTAATGLDDEAVRQLVGHGLLRWADRSRSGRLAIASVRNWVGGYRPDLLGRW